MKKIMSAFLVVVVLALISVIPASADSYDQFPEVDFKYYDIMVERNISKPWSYNELHHYSDKNQEEPDWALIACISNRDAWGMKYGIFVEDRLLWTMAGMGGKEFPIGYGVYLPATDELINLYNDNIDYVIDRCPEFVETLEKYGIGQLRGDINEDNKIDVLDATCVQRMIAGIYEYKTTVEVFYQQKYSEYDSIADFDKDGEVSVMDATAIQRHLAGLE